MINNSTNSFSIQPFTPELLSSAGQMCSRAFNDDPGFSYMFSNFEGKAKLEMLAWFWERFLWLSIAFNPDNYVIMDGSDVIAMVCLLYHDGHVATTWDMMKAGILKIPFKAGLKATLRVEKNAYNPLEDDILWKKLALDKTKYSKIEHIAVDPKFQGKGLGRKVVEYGIEKIKQKGYEGCFLFTQKLSNVDFYTKLGFERVGEWLVDKDVKDSPYHYLMLMKF